MRLEILLIMLMVSAVLVSGCVSDQGAGPDYQIGNGCTDEVCTDGLDNDCDGSIDCQDSDCSGAAACAGPSEPGTVQPEEQEPADQTIPIVSASEPDCGNGKCEYREITVKKDETGSITFDGVTHTFRVTSVNSVNEGVMDVDNTFKNAFLGSSYSLGSHSFTVTDIVYSSTSTTERFISIKMSETDSCAADCTWECTDGQTRDCGTDVGACEFGTQTCSGHTWGDCAGGTSSVKEVCGNQIDDDCDGQTDEECIDIVESVCGSNGCETPTLTVNKGQFKTVRIDGEEHRIEVTSVTSVIDAVVNVDYQEKAVSLGKSYTIAGSKGNVYFTIDAIDYQQVVNDRAVSFSFPETASCPSDC